MRDFMIETTADPIVEARRYVQNAKDVLEEKGKLDLETGCYEDSKYVKSAGHYLWSAVLIILDAVFDEVVKRDRKLLTMINAAYETMHRTMGYDGNLSKDVCQGGIHLATDIIDRCAAMLVKVA